jgi:hypothetical protein
MAVIGTFPANNLAVSLLEDEELIFEVFGKLI